MNGAPPPVNPPAKAPREAKAEAPAKLICGLPASRETEFCDCRLAMMPLGCAQTYANDSISLRTSAT
jgi:hypothetical protein